jgi:hypothetical protein
MDKAILLAIAASVCTATASLCQRKGAQEHPLDGTAAVSIPAPGCVWRRRSLAGHASNTFFAVTSGTHGEERVTPRRLPPPAAGHAAAPIHACISEPEHQVTVCLTLRILHQSSSQANWRGRLA